MSNDSIIIIENELLISQDIFKNIKLLQDGLQLIKSTKGKVLYINFIIKLYIIIILCYINFILYY
jgi:hypothetical protein